MDKSPYQDQTLNEKQNPQMLARFYGKIKVENQQGVAYAKHFQALKHSMMTCWTETERQLTTNEGPEKDGIMNVSVWIEEGCREYHLLPGISYVRTKWLNILNSHL